MIGKQLSSFTIDAELGSGGMGTVYRATGPDGPVAIKVVHPHLIATAGFFKRFLREADLGRKVTHPNVVRTLDVDATMVDDKQINYMVMEYVEGKSLRDLLNDLGRVPESLLREIARQTTAGLAAIHAGEIVHRDLKPENILITDDNEIRIMDLGVAKLQEASIAITKEGQFAGSLLYAAPEQFKRDEEVGPASDLYSLGVMLYELGTGQNPFRSDDAASVIQSHLNEEPARAHERNDELSLFYSELVANLLAKQPAQRFASAAALLDVLEKAEESEWWAKHEPVQIAQLPRIRVSRETALHGRDKDLALLRECFALAAGGNGNTVWLEGEAGIGKTRLVDAFLRELGDAHVLYGSYPPSGGMGGLSDAILGKFGSGQLAGALKPYLTATPTLVPAFAALVKHETPPTGSDPVQGDALQAIGVHLMRALAAEKPTVWVVDDLHFAPEESRNFVLALARAVEGHAVLVLVTSRPGVELADFSRLNNFRRLDIGRLSPREVQVLLRDAFRSELLADKLGAQIALKSDGVPFFVFEMIRGLKEGQFITQQADGTYVQTQVVDGIQVPSAVKDLIEQRMRDLTVDQRAMLDVGAVCGMSFNPALVAAVLEEKRVRVLRELAEIERRHGLVRGDAGQTHFDQNQIQEVLYADLPPDLRCEYHSLLAEAYEGDDAHFLALHHLRGSRPERGLEYVDPALDELLAGYRNEAAFELMDLALEHLEGRERARLLLRKAGRLDVVGDYAAAVPVASEAFELAKGEEDSLLLKALGLMGGAIRRVGRRDEAEATAREKLELAKGLGDRKHEAAALIALSSLTKKPDEGLSHADRALEIYRELEDRRGQAAALNTKGLALQHLHRYPEARECLERTLEVARETRNRNLEGGCLVNMGLAYQYMGRLDDAERCFEEGRAVLREVGNRAWEATAITNLGNVYADRGLITKALAMKKRNLALKMEVGERPAEAGANGRIASIYISLGRLDKAQPFAERNASLGRELGGDSERHSLWNQAALAQARGDLQEAEGIYRRIAAWEGIEDRVRGWAQLAIARLRPSDAAELLREAPTSERPGYEILAPALLGDREATLAALAKHGEAVSLAERMEAHFYIGDIEKAHELLCHARDHAPEDCRETMIENVKLHRDIMCAWEEHRAKTG